MTTYQAILSKPDITRMLQEAHLKAASMLNMGQRPTQDEATRISHLNKLLEFPTLLFIEKSSLDQYLITDYQARNSKPLDSMSAQMYAAIDWQSLIKADKAQYQYLMVFNGHAHQEYCYVSESF